MKFRLLACGDRNWSNRSLVVFVLTRLRPFISLLIEGECRGADVISREVADLLSIPVRKFPAAWEKEGKSAGPRRNTQILRESKPNIVVAFHDNIDSSVGTSDMIKQARRKYISTYLFSTLMNKADIEEKLNDIQAESEETL